jgi:hypothetical protein
MSAFSARLNAALARPRTPYRILRPDVVHDAPGVARWLRFHPDGGYLQSGDQERTAVAKRLLFVVWALYGRPADDDALRGAVADLDAVSAERRGGM